MTTIPPTLDTWHRLLNNRDIHGLETLLADDAVFYSPIVHRPQQGKALTLMYLSAAFQVLVNDSFHYVREVVGKQDAVLEFEVEIDGVRVNGVDMIHWNEAGEISEFKVMLRPLTAINLLHQKLAERLQAGQR